MVKKLESKMELLRAFLPQINKAYTIKDVMGKIKLSYQPTYQYLDELRRRGFLLHKKEGNVHFYSLNLENEEVKKHIELMELKRRNEFLKKSEFRELIGRLVGRIADNLSPYAHSIVLFGSAARGRYSKKSDIDIFVVVSSNDPAKIRELMKEAENICTSTGYEFNRAISPVTVPVSEFREMIRKKQEFAKNLLKDGIVLYGESAYYGEIIRLMGELKWIE